jgi:hypothetical protein
VHPGQHADLGRERPDVGEPATVDAEPVVDDPLADQLLGQRPDGRADLLLATLELLRETLLREGLDPVLLSGALPLACDGQRLGKLVGDRAGDRLEYVLAVIGEDRELGRARRGQAGLDRRGGQDLLRLAERGDERLGSLKALGDGLLVIMIATSPSSSIRPATTMSNVASSSCGCVGNATHWSLISATRTPPMGPANGSPASWVDIDAALIATTS